MEQHFKLSIEKKKMNYHVNEMISAD